MHRKTVLSLCLWIAAASMAWSQSYTATVRGVVTDSSGAAVPAAQVIITEAERNV